MNQSATLRRLLSVPPLAAACYLGLIILLLFVTASSIFDMLSQRADVAAAVAMLEQLKGHSPGARRGKAAEMAGPAGSPLLEGATVTVAGAALLQRVTSMVTKLGGNVLSSQVDLQGTESRNGFLTIIANCDIDQSALQRLLYEIEAGMPFLFVDQLSVQAASGFASSGEGRLRVLLSVSGQWQGAK